MAKRLRLLPLLIAACTSEDPGALDRHIHGYLLDHPELLREMGGRLQQREAEARQRQGRAAIAENRAALLAADGLASEGKSSADITLVEFFDAECPYCKKLAPLLERLLASNPHLRIVYRDFPILGEGSLQAARAGLAAREQGGGLALHRALMADPTPEHRLELGHILELARSVGLDPVRLQRDMAAPAIEAQIEANKALAERLAIGGTPGLVFLGPSAQQDDILPGAMSYESLLSKLAEMRQQAVNIVPQPDHY
jgi:protein-disulfide isomerase